MEVYVVDATHKGRKARRTPLRGPNAVPPTAVLLRGIIGAVGATYHKDDLARVGRTLAAIAGRPQPYSYKYVHSVINGNLEAGKKFALAVRNWADTVGGRKAIGLAGFSIVKVYGRPSQAGAQVDGRIGLCANPECGVKFLTDHPTRRFCKICHPPKRS